jgi:hypothetical protein
LLQKLGVLSLISPTTIAPPTAPPATTASVIVVPSPSTTPAPMAAPTLATNTSPPTGLSFLDSAGDMHAGASAVGGASVSGSSASTSGDAQSQTSATTAGARDVDALAMTSAVPWALLERLLSHSAPIGTARGKHDAPQLSVLLSDAAERLAPAVVVVTSAPTPTPSSATPATPIAAPALSLAVTSALSPAPAATMRESAQTPQPQLSNAVSVGGRSRSSGGVASGMASQQDVVAAGCVSYVCGDVDVLRSDGGTSTRHRLPRTDDVVSNIRGGERERVDEREHQHDAHVQWHDADCDDECVIVVDIVVSVAIDQRREHVWRHRVDNDDKLIKCELGVSEYERANIERGGSIAHGMRRFGGVC